MNIIFNVNICTVYDQVGKVISQFKTEYEGLTSSGFDAAILTPDNKIIVRNWYRGLFCYDIEGKVIWHEGPGKVGNMFIYEDQLIIEIVNRGVYKRDWKSGKLLDKISMSAIEKMIRVSDKHIFTGPKNNTYSLLEVATFKPIMEITRKELDPDECLSFVIMDAKLNGKELLVTGWKEYPNRDHTKDGNINFYFKINI